MNCMLYVLLLAFMVPCTAQVRFNSLQECIDYSKQNNLALKAENLNQEISHEKIKSAWSVLLPQVKAFSTLDNNISLPVSLIPAQILGGQPGEYAKVKFGTRYNATYGAEASLSLINVSNWQNLKSAKLGEDMSHYQWSDRELSIREQLVTSYFFALLSREAIALNRDMLNSSDSLLRAAQARLTNGLIEPLEFNRVKTLYLETQQLLFESEGAFQKNLSALKALCGISESDSLLLTQGFGNLMQNNTPTSMTVTVEQLPRYHFLSAKASQAQQDLRRQQAKIFPELSMYGRISKQTFSNQFNITSSSQQWFNISVVGFRAEWNIFTGLNRQSLIRQNSLQAQAARYELENYVLQSEKELDEISVNHAVAVQGIQRFSEHFQLSSSNYRIAGEKYTQGVYTIDQYVTIYQEMVRSQNQYLNKLANYLIYESIIQARNALK